MTADPAVPLHSPSSRESRPFLIVSVGINVLFCVLIWGMLVRYSTHGFDLTDESFYLLNYRDYQDVTATITLFGAVWKPIFDLTAENIVLSRILGYALLVGATVIAALTTLRVLSSRDPFRANLLLPLDRLNLVLVAVASASVYYWGWRRTPSYDWQTLVSLLVFWAGLLLWLDYSSATRSRRGLALIGFSAAVIFWAKPSSAALLPFFMIVALILQRTHWKPLLAPPTIAWGLIGFAGGMSFPFLQGDSVAGIIEKFQIGFEYQQLLKPNQYGGAIGFLGGELIKLLALIVSLAYNLVLFLPLWGIPAALALNMKRVSRRLSRRFRLKQARQLQSMELILALGWIINVVVALSVSRWMGTVFLYLLGLAVIFLLISDIAAARITGNERISGQRPLTGLGWIIPLFSLNIVFMFGTDALYLSHSAGAVTFFMLAVIVPMLLYSSSTNQSLRSVMLSTLVIVSFAIVYKAADHPYQQFDAITDMNTSVSFHRDGNTLIVGEGLARYIAEFRAIAATNGFEADTPLIDLTGHTPGIVYVLNARTFGFPWLLGGFTGSDDATAFLLSKVDSSALRSAWIVTAEHNGTHELNATAIMGQLGLSFPADYVKAGEVRFVDTEEVQALWHPRR